MSEHDTAPAGDAWSVRGHRWQSSQMGLREAEEEELTAGNTADEDQIDEQKWN